MCETNEANSRGKAKHSKETHNSNKKSNMSFTSTIGEPGTEGVRGLWIWNIGEGEDSLHEEDDEIWEEMSVRIPNDFEKKSPQVSPITNRRESEIMQRARRRVEKAINLNGSPTNPRHKRISANKLLVNRSLFSNTKDPKRDSL